jgi:hypothetical protein
MPTRPTPCRRSDGTNAAASSAVQIDALATRIAASDEETFVSPAAMSRNGPAIWTAATRASVPRWRRAGIRAPRLMATGSRTIAPSAVRARTTATGLRSSSAILMNMYEAPHSAARTPSRTQARRCTVTD